MSEKPKFELPKQLEKESKAMSTEVKTGLASFVGKRMSKTVKFMGADLEIFKLSVAEVMSIQDMAKEAEANKADETAQFSVLRTIIRRGAANARSLTDEEFDNFSMDELSALSQNIMKFSGLGEDKDGKGKN